MSQTDAALRLGIQQGHFSKLERGQVRPSSQLSGRIEAWLGE
jgi:transcriptional regulator with XRE-family HTH domain